MATHNAHNLYGYMNDINANIMKIIVTVANNYSNYNGVLMIFHILFSKQIIVRSVKYL